MYEHMFHAALVSFVTLVLVGCNGNAGPGEAPSTVAEGEYPAGSTVTVSGEIARRFDDHTFSLGDDEWGENLVIVTKQPLPQVIEEDVVFEVTGTVEKYGVLEFEREYDWDFDPQIEIELEDVESFLYADTYRILGTEDEVQ